MVHDSLLNKALAAKRESKQIEFKETLDVESSQDWCEIIKDLVALANSGGGIVLFGLNNRGEPTGVIPAALRALDPAVIGDRIRPYTGIQFAEVDIQEAEKDGRRVIAWLVKPAEIPMVFIKPGTYPIQGGKQRSAFGQGTIYFRHGAKSEPGTTEDLAKHISQKLESIRKEWLSGIRRIVLSPVASRAAVLPPEIRQSENPGATPIRITDDPNAPAYRVIDPDTTHPFRQKELIAEVRKRLGPSIRFNSFDVVSIRRAHKVDQNADFVHHPKFGSPQYSLKFVDWIVSKYEADSSFFKVTRDVRKIL